jgi:hypothetical protein
MGPNDGSGDNVFFSLIGPGTSITGIGGMACIDWCFGPIPDLNSVSTSQVFISLFINTKIGGTVYDPNTLSICCFFSPSGDLNGSATGSVGGQGTFTQFNLTLPGGGGWNLSFDFFPASGDSPAYYQFVSGTFTAGTPPAPVPEPGTLGFMATGLTGLVGVVRRKWLIRRRRTH